MIREISRSGHKAYSECQRKFYYNYLYKGIGYVATAPAVHLMIGLAVHKGLEPVLLGRGEKAWDVTGEEWARLAEPWMDSEDPLLITQLEAYGELAQALVYAWYTRRSKSFLDRFEVLSVEKELRAPLASNIILLARCDGVIRDREDGSVYVLNWKTTGKSDNWGGEWLYDIQAITEALAVEHDLGEPVTGVLFEGLYKGYKKEGLFINPLTWGWTRDMPYGTEFAWSRPRKEKRNEPSWRRLHAREARLPTGGEGIRGWIDWLPDEAIQKHILTSPPVMKNNDVVEDWLAQVVRRETDLAYVLENGDEKEALNFLWQNWGNQCKWCPYQDVCNKVTTIDEMIKDGKLVEREEHHKGGEDGQSKSN